MVVRNYPMPTSTQIANEQVFQTAWRALRESLPVAGLRVAAREKVECYLRYLAEPSQSRCRYRTPAGIQPRALQATREAYVRACTQHPNHDGMGTKAPWYAATRERVRQNPARTPIITHEYDVGIVVSSTRR